MWWKLMVITPLCMLVVLWVITAVFQSSWGEGNWKEKLQTFVKWLEKEKMKIISSLRTVKK